jgi:hypothetical protein
LLPTTPKETAVTVVEGKAWKLTKQRPMRFWLRKHGAAVGYSVEIVAEWLLAD